MTWKGYMLVGLFASLFVFGCGEQASQKSTAQAPEAAVPAPDMSTPGFLIDSHIHYSATDEWEKSFLEIFGKWNAMGCVLVRMGDLDRGIAFAKAHPDRVIPYAAVNIDSPTVLKDIQKAYDMGYKGIGEVFGRTLNYDDPTYDRIWAICEKLHLPIAPHTGIHASGQMSRMEPGYLGTIAVKFPNLLIHAAHFGNPWYNEAGEIARRNKNIYFDMSGSSLIKYDGNPGIWTQYLWWTPYIGKPHMPKDAVPAFQKIVFATDQEPEGLEENILRFNKMLNACGVSEETRRKCYYETIAEMHGIDVSKYLKK